MHLDVLDLRSFYYRTKLGRVAQRAIRDQVVMAWPAGMPNVSVLVEEACWPVQTGMLDRLIMLHGLETSEQPGVLLQEAHRALGPGGRALFIVPSRSGLWARRDGTPFGFGKPYSIGQLEAQLRQNNFTIERSTSVLFAPPSGHGFWLRTSDFWERNGRRFTPWLAGGVLMVEASKQTHAPVNGGLGAVVRKPLRILEGLANPIPAARKGNGRPEAGEGRAEV